MSASPLGETDLVWEGLGLVVWAGLVVVVVVCIQLIEWATRRLTLVVAIGDRVAPRRG